MARMGKWIEGLAPGDKIVDVAAQTLQARMAAVQHYLPRAAEWTEGCIEDVHQLRVSTRRARSAIDLYHDVLPSSRAKRVISKLKRIRQAAGEARDCDVLILRLSDGAGRKNSREELDRILKRLRRQRASAQPPIREACKRLTAKDKLQRRTDQLIERIRDKSGKSGSLKFRMWAPSVFQPVVKRFLAAAPETKPQLEDLHRFRIRGKALRYTMELLAPAYPSNFRDKLYPLIGELQQLLGDVNDHCSAAARFRQLVETAEDKAEQKLFKRLSDDEEQLIESSQKAFWKWWTPDFHRELENGLQAYCQRA